MSRDLSAVARALEQLVVLAAQEAGVETERATGRVVRLAAAVDAFEVTLRAPRVLGRVQIMASVVEDSAPDALFDLIERDIRRLAAQLRGTTLRVLDSKQPIDFTGDLVEGEDRHQRLERMGMRLIEEGERLIAKLDKRALQPGQGYDTRLTDRDLYLIMRGLDALSSHDNRPPHALVEELTKRLARSGVTP